MSSSEELETAARTIFEEALEKAQPQDPADVNYEFHVMWGVLGAVMNFMMTEYPVTFDHIAQAYRDVGVPVPPGVDLETAKRERAAFMKSMGNQEGSV